MARPGQFPQEMDMGLLDSVIGALGGGVFGGRSGRGDLLQAVIAMLAEGGTRASDGASGGLGGLVTQFEQAGLGHVIDSWIAKGRNLPVSADQLNKVLGPEAIGHLAAQTDLPPGEVSDRLTRLLPQLVDRLTPRGQLDNERDTGFGDMGSVLERFSKH